MILAYEWDVEELDPSFPRDVLEHNHSGKLSTIGFTPDELKNRNLQLVLVRDRSTPNDGVIDRMWSYAKFDENGVLRLPEHMSNAWGDPTDVKVPQRFHRELERWLQCVT